MSPVRAHVCFLLMLCTLPGLACRQEPAAPKASPPAPARPAPAPEPEVVDPDVVVDVLTGKPIPGRKPLVLEPAPSRPSRKIGEQESVPTIVALMDLFNRGVIHPMAPRSWRVPGRAAYETLHQAASAGDLYAVEDRLNGGADVSARDEEGRLPLHAAVAANQPYIVTLLKERGADLSATDALGNQAIHLAARSSHVYTLEHLRGLGASLEARNGDNRTPLHIAAANGELFAVQKLVALGADITSLADPNVLSIPAVVAAREEQWEVAAFFRAHGQLLPLHLMAGWAPRSSSRRTMSGRLLTTAVMSGVF